MIFGAFSRIAIETAMLLRSQLWSARNSLHEEDGTDQECGAQPPLNFCGSVNE